MGMMDKIKTFLKGNRRKNDIDLLNDICNKDFEAVFNTCRIEFGREMVGLMDMKRGMMEKGNSVEGYTPLQEMLVRKVLELISMYLKLAYSYVGIQKGCPPDETITVCLGSTKEKMERVYCLLSSLHRQFYIKDDSVSCSQDLIDEAQALCNVLQKDSI